MVETAEGGCNSYKRAHRAMVLVRPLDLLLDKIGHNSTIRPYYRTFVCRKREYYKCYVPQGMFPREEEEVCGINGIIEIKSSLQR